MTQAGREFQDVVRFADFSIDRRTEVLLRNEERVPLAPKALQLLMLLIDNAPNLVSRDDLRTAIWKDSNYIEFEGALNSCVRQVRSALGDSADRSEFVETLPKRGYRFVAQLKAADQPAQARGRGAMLIAVGLAAAAIVVAMLLTLAQPNRQPAILVMLPLEGNGDLAIDPIAAYGAAVIAAEDLRRLDPTKLSVVNSRSVRELAVADSDIPFAKTPDLVVRTRIRRGSPGFVLSADLQRNADGVILSTLERQLDATLASSLRATPEVVVEWLRGALRLPAAKSAVKNRNSVTDDITVSGYWHLESGTPEGVNRALATFDAALELDPDHVWALEGRLTALLEKSLLPATREAVERTYSQIEVLAADMQDRRINSAKPYEALGLVRLFRDWDPAAAQNLVEAALLIAPNDARTHSAYAAVRAALGDPAGAVESSETAERLDPATMVVRSDRCWFLLFDRRYQQAASVCRNALSLRADNTALLGLAYALVNTGEGDKATALLVERIRQNSPAAYDDPAEIPETWSELGCSRADTILARDDRLNVSHIQLARYLASCGRTEASLLELAAAIDDREYGALFLRYYTDFDPLREHPEFERLEARLP